ncbi:probable serine/threonine-protein kinase DDB_G0283337 [Melitaea cinxia]|uniref:probable serine/threonine-protein kinase DDB_G0283337 n=1 Tax=Melitaea cinxia TaxID=113334 RepID=UPI001E273E5D|nr:probable serine/threonine-protein kinase DDB_G0283337 [Melitaea cinxia]
MPLMKRRKSNNENIKEKKAIATRLMVISLKVDDYIYKNKPISLQEAQEYIKEIATYKLKCVNDERSLQVIEKLTIFMKSIINENNMCHDSNEYLNTESEAIKDGVTENTDDSKIIPNDTVTDINKKDWADEINIVDLTISKNDEQNESHTEVQNITMKAMSNMSLHNSVINLNGDTNDLQSPSIINGRNGYDFELNSDSSILIQNGQNKNTHLTIAGKYIKDFEAANIMGNNSKHIDNKNIQTPSTINEGNGYGIGWNCDSSILIQEEQNKNTRLTFARNNITDLQIPNIINNISNQVDSNIQSPSLINERNGYGIGLNCDSPNLIQNDQYTYSTIAENDIRDFEVTNVIENNNNQIGNNSNQKIQKLFGIDDKNIENKQNSIIKDVKTCKCLKNDNEINVITPKVNDKKDKIEATVKNSKLKPKEKTVRTKKAIKSIDTDKNQNINKIRKKKGEITKKNNKRNTKTNVLNTFDSNSSKNNIVPELHKEKERKEDLSWIENLKYVREISKEEYDSTQTIEETFWNDLSLPVDFNWNDFDYTD